MNTDQDAINAMIEWFHIHYEDPVESQPVEGGEYFWLVRKCDAREELEENFPEAADHLIDAAVIEIENDGGYEWVSLEDLKNFSK